MCHYLLKDSYTDINKVYPKIDTYDTLISKSKKILDRIKETAKEIDENFLNYFPAINREKFLNYIR